MKLCIVTPVYFDAPSFQRLHADIRAQSAAIPEITAIGFVVIDDSAGADPATADLVALSNTEIVRPPYNLGHQRTLVYGLRATLPGLTRDDVVVTMDSDGEDKATDLPRLVRACLDDGTLALAVRTSRETTLIFRLAYLLFRLMFRVLTGQVVRSGNFAAYQAGSMKRLIRNPNFNLCYSATLVALGVPTTGVPCARGRRYAGRSKMTYSKLAVHGLRMLMPFIDRIAIRAICAFTLVFLAGVITCIVLVALRVLMHFAVPGWASIALLSVLVLSFVALGNVLLIFVLFSQSRSVTHLGLEGKDGD